MGKTMHTVITNIFLYAKMCVYARKSEERALRAIEILTSGIKVTRHDIEKRSQVNYALRKVIENL